MENFEEVLAAAKSGSDQAFSTIFRELGPTVAGYFRGQGVRDVDDLVAETFVGVARNLRRFSGDEDGFRGWVFRIAQRRCIDYRRKAGRRKEQAFDPQTMPAASVVDPDVDTGEIAELLEVLTPDQRQVVLLRILGGFSVKETAAVMGKRENAIKVLQHRAVNALARHLDGAGRNALVAASDGDEG